MAAVNSVELAIGRQMGQFYRHISATTPQVQEFAGRGLARAIVWAPARMIDSVQEMLNAWRTHPMPPPGQQAGPAPMLPVMLVALAREFDSAEAQWGRSVSDALPIIHEADPMARIYHLRTTMEMQRMQVVVIASEPHSAHSLASQFVLFCQSHAGRCFEHSTEHAGCEIALPVQLADLNLGAVDSAIEQKNITILTIDIRWLITTPYLQAPGPGEANDGQAAPAGYPVLRDWSAQTSTGTGGTGTGDPA